jgi:hypothetical protein
VTSGTTDKTKLLQWFRDNINTIRCLVFMSACLSNPNIRRKVTSTR